MKSKIRMHTLLLVKIMLSIVEQFKRHHPRIFLNNNVDHLYIYFSFVNLTKKNRLNSDTHEVHSHTNKIKTTAQAS